MKRPKKILDDGFRRNIYKAEKERQRAKNFLILLTGFLILLIVLALLIVGDFFFPLPPNDTPNDHQDVLQVEWINITFNKTVEIQPGQNMCIRQISIQSTKAVGEIGECPDKNP